MDDDKLVTVGGGGGDFFLLTIKNQTAQDIISREKRFGEGDSMGEAENFIPNYLKQKALSGNLQYKIQEEYNPSINDFVLSKQEELKPVKPSWFGEEEESPFELGSYTSDNSLKIGSEEMILKTPRHKVLFVEENFGESGKYEKGYEDEGFLKISKLLPLFRKYNVHSELKGDWSVVDGGGILYYKEYSLKGYDFLFYIRHAAYNNYDCQVVFESRGLDVSVGSLYTGGMNEPKSDVEKAFRKSKSTREFARNLDWDFNESSEAALQE